MDIKIETANRAKETEEVIKEFLPKEEGLQISIFKAMNYSVCAGGKRLRPMLMSETHKLFGGESKALKYFMAAMEYLHTYSLVHDDLPAMDNDDYRRGRLTTHKVFGEDIGILAGDALLNYAFETVSKAFDTDEDKGRIGNAFKVFSQKAGVYGMIGGQCVDVEKEGQEVTLEELNFIHSLKTCALIEASMMIGAILAGADDEDVDKIEKAAHEIGMAFQIQDDILDVTGDEEVLGKPVGSDEKNNKMTYVNHIGLENAKEEVRVRSEKAVDILKSFPEQNEFLNELVIYLISRKK
ncbi:MAG: polyprenyl synthetase family protein [Eubacterium sp.]|nr:polyprenyl synthetase family protein [Eubacterium sp.]